jgi:RNA polymerase primary sigma factor
MGVYLESLWSDLGGECRNPMAKFSKIPLSIEGGALAQYLDELSQLDLLTPEEEQELAHRVREGDEEAKERLIVGNLRFVVTIAKQYRNHGMPLSDLISEGNLGLIEATGRFDPSRGFKFISYAVWWIRHAILSALADRGRSVRLPQNRIQTLDRILETSRRLEQETGQRPTSVEIATELEMTPERVEDVLMTSRRHRSLDAPLGDDDADRRRMDILDNDEQPPDEEAMDRLLLEEIQGALDMLDEREAEIVRLYYGIEREDSMTLEELSERYGLTRERVRQIKQKALSRLRHPVRRGRLEEFWEN